MKEYPHNFATTDDSMEAKLDPKGWLTVWRLKNLGEFGSAIIPIYVCGGKIGTERALNSRDINYARKSVKFFQSIPGFCGMVYCMVDMRVPDILKIGEARDAWARMRRSPWRPELGRTPHAHRHVEFVLACFSVRPKQVETALHRLLKRLSTSFGRGREWFIANRADTSAAIQNLIEVYDEAIWVRGFANVSRNNYFPLNAPASPFESPASDHVFSSRAAAGGGSWSSRKI